MKELGLKSSVMKSEKLELKSAMKVDEECQSGFDTMWEKVVKNSYSINCYNPNLYPIFTKKFKEKNKLTL